MCGNGEKKGKGKIDENGGKEEKAIKTEREKIFFYKNKKKKPMKKRKK